MGGLDPETKAAADRLVDKFFGTPGFVYLDLAEIGKRLGNDGAAYACARIGDGIKKQVVAGKARETRGSPADDGSSMLPGSTFMLAYDNTKETGDPWYHWEQDMSDPWAVSRMTRIGSEPVTLH
ncbi:MAG: hypothetical protein HY362_04300 [Candidatus Aenigmarchaeota archaeon]|nr:hypothetical protein [Candidatus Aenigmarchaeota archaeon]